MQSAAKNFHRSRNLKVKAEGCENSNFLPIITRSNGHLVAMLADRNIANANLFAAAPALLAALESVAQTAEDYEDAPETIELWQTLDVLKAIAVDCRAAIAKAEGR